MAGDNYTPNLRGLGIPEADVTASEDRPMLDVALPPPPEITRLQDQLIGESVSPVGGQAVIRVVHAAGGQSQVPDGSG